MAKKSAPIKLTGGRGFSFEDKVAAWYLAHLLTGRTPLGPSYGTVSRVDFQVGESGWRLDDLLITLHSSGTSRRAAISIKSNAQVTRKGLPANFVLSAWEHWTGWDQNPFEKNRDLLILAISRVAESISTAWELMLSEAIQGDPVRVTDRLTTGAPSKLQKAIFSSLQCPASLSSTSGTEPNDAADLLSHLRLIPFSFENSTSTHESSAIALCGDALVTATNSEGSRLWDQLLGIAKEQRGYGGYVDLPKLLSLLRSKFHLREFPDFETDWQILRRLTSDAMQEVKTDIFGSVHLSRDVEVTKIKSQLDADKVVVLIGESGWGKSAIARKLAEDIGQFGRVLWLTAQELDKTGMLNVERDLGIRNTLLSLIESVASKRALIVFDGLDRYSDEALRCAATLTKHALASTKPRAWAILATSQLDGWERAARVFFREGVSEVVPLPLKEPAAEEVREVLRSITPLRPLASRQDLLRAFSNLKILDWVASAAVYKVPEGADGWIGVPDLADWIWDYWQGTGTDRLARSAVLREISEIEGETLANGVPETRLGTNELGIAGILISDQLLKIRDGRLFFTHDLASDWARYRSVVSNPDVERLVKLAAMPRWHSAIRLYGQRLLEHGQEDCTEWRALMKGMTEGAPNGELAADILLDSVIFSVPAAPYLEKLSLDLMANNGVLQNKLLNRFLHVATIPDPRIALLAKESDLSLWLSSSLRLPLWYFWGPMLTFLRNHCDEVVKFSPGTLAKISSLWLKNTPTKTAEGRQYPWRKEAAELALALAREVQARKCEEVYFSDDVDVLAYEAVLNGTTDLPEETSTLALELSCRRSVAPEIQARADEHRRSEVVRRAEREIDPAYQERMKKLVGLSSLPLSEGPLRGPWPDGPSDQVDRGFQKACLEKGCISQLVIVRPQIAKEVILALCIKAPYHESLYCRDHLFDDYSLEDWLIADQPMYFTGPFLHFLQVHPEDGLDLIIKLVNFATSRWRERQENHERRPSKRPVVTNHEVTIRTTEGVRTWYGDAQVYGWYRDWPHAPKSCTAALMALEKWFYDKIDAGEETSHWVNKIFQNGMSVAFAGALIGVGKYKPELLEGPLLPLMGIWQCYGWDQQVVMHADLWAISMSLWTNSGETIFNLVRDWHNRTHRKILLEDLGVRLLFAKPIVREFLNSEREHWLQDSPPEDLDDIQRLNLIFNIDNYTFTPGPTEETVLISFNWPEELRNEKELLAKSAETRLRVLTFPARSRRILNGEDNLAVDGLEDFWHEIQAIAELQNIDPDHDVRADALCGGIAVLIRNHRDWLWSDSARGEWCISKLRDIFISPPDFRQFDMPESPGDFSWDSFAAEAAITLFAEDKGNTDWRAAVVVSVMSFHYGATGITLRKAFEERQKLDDDFARLLNVAVLWSGLAFLNPRHHDDQLRANVLRKWASRLIEGFVLKTIPSELMSWTRIANFVARLRARQRARRFAESPWSKIDKISSRRKGSELRDGLHPTVLLNAFDWIPTLDQAKTHDETNLFLALHDNLLQVCLANAPVSGKENQSGSRDLPTQFDHWVFGKLVRLIVRSEPSEFADRYWKPLFELCPIAHKWPEDFLREWFTTGVQAAPSFEQFTAHWRRMIKYTSEAPSWQPSPGRYHYDLCNLHTETMGLRWGGRIIGGTEFADHIGSLALLYQNWAKQWLAYEDSATAFASFLTRPAAAKLLLNGLLWIDAAMEDNHWHRWGSRLKEALVELLSKVWNEHRKTLEIDEGLRRSFTRILAALVKRQVPAALQLQDAVVS